MPALLGFSVREGDKKPFIVLFLYKKTKNDYKTRKQT